VVIVVSACRREPEALPLEVRGYLADALARLEVGLVLTMPLSRAMPSIGRASASYGFGIVPVTTA
jgi:hypothetical protein